MLAFVRGALKKTSRVESIATRLFFSSPAGIGDRVHVHYKFTSLTDPSADSIDSKATKDGRPDVRTTGEPLLITLGAQQTMRALENGAKGMAVGESKTMKLEPLDAFGKVAPDVRIPTSQLPKDLCEKLEPGLAVLTQHGHVVVVKEIDEETNDVVFDPNHPFADHEVECEMEIVKVEESSAIPFAEKLVLPSIETDTCKEGDGITSPGRGDTCVMHYTGKLMESDKTFDSSRDRGEPFEFVIGIGNVIQGWDEGVMHMTKGQRALLKIPSQKGYGDQGAGGAIPPNADLVFDVELLDIKRG